MDRSGSVNQSNVGYGRRSDRDLMDTAIILQYERVNATGPAPGRAPHRDLTGILRRRGEFDSAALKAGAMSATGV